MKWEGESEAGGRDGIEDVRYYTTCLYGFLERESSILTRDFSSWSSDQISVHALIPQTFLSALKIAIEAHVTVKLTLL